jgi:hypothetical protein
MKKIFKILHLLVSFSFFVNATALKDEIMVLHSAATAEMNAVSNPVEGTLIYNQDEQKMYEFNDTSWSRMTNDGSDTKIIKDNNCTSITGTGTISNPYVISRSLPGKTKETAGTTCKTLLEDECVFNKSGMYWINPDEGDTSNAFEVYCDMETDGGGWTRLDYVSSLTYKSQFPGQGDGSRWIQNNFVLALTDTQINNIRAQSTQGKQRFHVVCSRVVAYKFAARNNYNYAFGFRFHDGSTTANSQQTYPNTSITVKYDGCRLNDSTQRAVDFNIADRRVPVINVKSKDNGASNEKFGSPLRSNPAWLR